MIRGYAPRHALMGRLVGAGFPSGFGGTQDGGPMAVMAGLPPGFGNPNWQGLSNCGPQGCFPSGLNFQANQGCAQPRMLTFGISSADASNGTTIINGKIVAGATATLSGVPQACFKPQRMVISSAVAPYFLVAITIGARPQTVNGGNAQVSAVLFSEVAQNTLLDYDTVSPGITVSLTVTNIDSVDHRFDLSMIGAATVY